jgi:hypothetical protein
LKFKLLQPLALLLLAGAAAFGQGINTQSSWNGTSFISSFGVTDTATYGQTITLASASTLNGFSFNVGYCGANVTFRPHVYAWNGTRATGSSLFDGAAVTLSAASTTNTFVPVSINTGNLSLAAGQYVLFFSTSQDQTGAPASSCRFGALTNDTTYTGGQFVYENNTTDTAQWTGTAWSVINEDLAMVVTINGSSSSVVGTPTLSEWGMIALAGLLAFAGLLQTRRRNQAV